ncbi:hypothetical protein NP233_g3788 [Leucocoprinus birnbaumii]|uniref:Hydrophobin n=1 Tax=Leucocoprinus birnbaumii TaxID=56174 RepID=A0AAD5YSH6_9AGAR|nr:hypothetical protein NP233_g3788 [Leucocoprinus birnbaumii]
MFLKHTVFLVAVAIFGSATPQGTAPSAAPPSNAPTTATPIRQCANTNLYCCQSLTKASSLRDQMTKAGVVNAKYVSDDLTIGSTCKPHFAPWLGGKCGADTSTAACCWGPALKQDAKTQMVFDCMSYKDVLAQKKPTSQ